MSDDDYEFFKLRKEGKTYISKVFTYGAHDTEKKRHVRMIIDDCDEMHFGEIEGVLCLRLTGKVRKTQVSAIVTQDDNKIKRLSLQTFKHFGGDWIKSIKEEEFTFRGNEFLRLQKFLKSIDFIDFSNEDNFKITDISKTEGPKTIVDASDSAIIDRINGMPSDQKISFLDRIQNSLTNEEINILLGRKQGIEEFERQLGSKNWSEAQWQIFFEKEQWVFGYGLDYRITRPFDREVTVGIGGTDNKDKPIIDFLMTFTDYTVLVEIKKPDTPIFKRKRGGRAGTWEFSSEFMSAVSQIIEQKAEWLHYAQTTQHYKKSGTEILTARTKNAKSILVIGTRDEFSDDQDLRSANIRRDTFELFRRENRSIDIITFDEMLERAQFITRDR